jgi:hypothetical protein
MSMGLNRSHANGSVTSYFDEAVQVIHLQWENQNDFAAAVAETLRALFTADAAYVGSIDITTGIRQPIVNDLLAELDPQSSRWLQTTIERLTLAFEQRARDARSRNRIGPSIGGLRETPMRIFRERSTWATNWARWFRSGKAELWSIFL